MAKKQPPKKTRTRAETSKPKSTSGKVQEIIDRLDKVEERITAKEAAKSSKEAEKKALESFVKKYSPSDVAKSAEESAKALADKRSSVEAKMDVEEALERRTPQRRRLDALLEKGERLDKAAAREAEKNAAKKAAREAAEKAERLKSSKPFVFKSAEESARSFPASRTATEARLDAKEAFEKLPPEQPKVTSPKSASESAKVFEPTPKSRLERRLELEEAFKDLPEQPSVKQPRPTGPRVPEITKTAQQSAEAFKQRTPLEAALDFEEASRKPVASRARELATRESIDDILKQIETTPPSKVTPSPAVKNIASNVSSDSSKRMFKEGAEEVAKQADDVGSSMAKQVRSRINQLVTETAETAAKETAETVGKEAASMLPVPYKAPIAKSGLKSSLGKAVGPVVGIGLTALELKEAMDLYDQGKYKEAAEVLGGSVGGLALGSLGAAAGAAGGFGVGSLPLAIAGGAAGGMAGNVGGRALAGKAYDYFSDKPEPAALKKEPTQEPSPKPTAPQKQDEPINEYPVETESTPSISENDIEKSSEEDDGGVDTGLGFKEYPIE